MREMRLVLASASAVRAQLLVNAGLTITVAPARIDEDAIRATLQAEAATPRDIADALAEYKARKISAHDPEALVIGCDQVLDFNGTVLSKPLSPDDAIRQLSALAGQQHQLFSAVVLYQGGQPVWRHIGAATLTMRPLSPTYITDYIARNWESIRHAVGCYKLEEEGVRLLSAIEGDYFTVLGLPLFPLLDYLCLRGVIST